MANDLKSPDSVHALLLQLKEANIPSEQYAGFVRRFLEFKAREHGVPYSGKFELTPLCNLDCKMCYVHLDKEQLQGSKLLSAVQWKELMTQAAEQGMMEALLTGGECLIYPDFDELYLHLMNLGVETAIYTNGILLDEKRIAFLKAYPAKDIQISLYGSSEEAYEKVTGFRSFQKVLHNIQMAKEADLPIRLAITPSIYMKEDVDNIIRLAHELGVPYSINWSLFDPRESTGRHGQPMDLDVEDYVRIYHLKWQLDGRQTEAVPYESLPDFGGGSREAGKGLYCGGGRSGFSMGYDGTMYICGQLREVKAYPLETGFSAAWQVINHAAENYPVPCQCVGCQYRGECPNCVVQHQKGAAPGQANLLICERTRRMAAEGFFSIKINN